MGAFFESISPSLVEWLLKQKMFVVATAPLHNQGHVNVSPKGGDVFGMVDLKTFWYMEMSGSGSETVSHLYEPGNGRITIMFMAFDGPPRILRLWGKGRCLESGSAEFQDFVSKHNVQTRPGTRSIICVDVHQIGTSCGFSVPYYDFKAHREILNDFYKKKDEKYQAGNESESLERYDSSNDSQRASADPEQILGAQECLEYRWTAVVQSRAEDRQAGKDRTH